MSPHASTLSSIVAVACLTAFACLAACGGPPARTDPSLVAEAIRAPVADSVLNPWLAEGDDGAAILSWLAPLGGARSALRFAEFDGARWSPVRTVVEDDSLFIHATEIPSVRAIGAGRLAAVWQRRTAPASGEDGYEIRVALSSDRGATWSAALTPHRSPTPGGSFEFPTAYRTAAGELGLFWIDPRRQVVRPRPDNPKELDYLGSRNVMWTTVSPTGALGPELEVDSIACECCPMGVGVSGDATVFAYRDKLVPETMPAESLRYELDVVRDIAVARLGQADGAPSWRHTGVVHRDGWVYNGCPNNGPSVDARDSRVAVAWWTAEGGDPRVQLAFSTDGGHTFGSPARVSDGRTDGQAGVALIPGGAVVIWLEGGEVRARRVGDDGKASSSIALGPYVGRHRLPAPIRTTSSRLVVTWLGSDGRLTSRVLEVGAGTPPTVTAAVALGPAQRGVGPALHNRLLKADPAADSEVTGSPKELRLWFSQKPDAGLTTIKLLGADSATVPLGPVKAADSSSVRVAVTGELAPGRYLVRWKTASDDGHVIRGRYGFTRTR